MHPNSAFRWNDDAAVLAAAADIGFAHIFAATAGGPMVAHAPVVPGVGRALRFHLARANRLAGHLEGAHALLSVAGAHGYISPGWYAESVNQVPTWNYVAIEVEGVVRALDEDALVAQLDTLAARHEPRVAPDKPWTRDKMDEAVFRKMLSAIRCFELQIDAVRATVKLGQNKRAADRAGAIAGLRRSANALLAEAMEVCG